MDEVVFVSSGNGFQVSTLKVLLVHQAVWFVSLPLARIVLSITGTASSLAAA